MSRYAPRMRNFRGAAWLVVGCGGVLSATGWQVARAEPVVTRSVIGTSAGGREIVVETIAEAGEDAVGRGPDARPALAVIAGLDARHTVGVSVAAGLAERLRSSHAAVFEGRTVYVIAVANPDGAAVAAEGKRPAADTGRAPREMDADRDGRVGEDPGEDLNGDGLITMMRVPRPARVTGLVATVLPDPADARLVREPDADKGEVATHALLIEGTDNDGDGAYNEDGWGGSAGGGVNLDRNFPSFWPDVAEDAGLHPLSEPETLAIVRWLQARPNVQAVLVYGPGDNLRNVPAAKQFDESGEMPKGLEERDKPAFEAMAKAYTEAMGEGWAAAPEGAGSLTAWAYSDLGVWSLRSAVWARPKAEAAKGDEPNEAEAAQPDGAAATPAVSEREALLARGVHPELVTFLTATPEERAALMADFEASSPDAQAEALLAIETAPEDIRTRVLALVEGRADPALTAAPVDDAAAAADATAAKPKAEDAKKPKDTEDAKWLAYLDAARGGSGFVTWQAFEHPQLGEVEIGGFAPGARHTPPADAIPGLIEKHAAFAADVALRLADLRTGSAVVERAGPGLYRVTLTLSNPGKLSTVTAIGEKAARLAPVVAELDVEIPRIVSGSRAVRLGPIAGGDEEQVEWLVMARVGEKGQITVRSAVFGDRSVPVEFGR